MNAARTVEGEELLEHLRKASNREALESVGIKPADLDDKQLLTRFAIHRDTLDTPQRDRMMGELAQTGAVVTRFGDAEPERKRVEPRTLTAAEQKAAASLAAEVWTPLADRISATAERGQTYVDRAYDALNDNDLGRAQTEVEAAGQVASEIRHAFRYSVKNAGSTLRDRMSDEFGQNVWSEDMNAVFEKVRADTFKPPRTVIEFTRQMAGLEGDYGAVRDRAADRGNDPQPDNSPKPN